MDRRLSSTSLWYSRRLNGFVITRFRVPPFVATLGMLSIARGLAMLWTGGIPTTGLGKPFKALGTGAFFGVLNNGLFLLNVSPFWQQVITGGVILLAVATDKINTKGRDE